MAKRAVTEEKVFCDFCENSGWAQCLVCGKDICADHRLELVLYLRYQKNEFRASLCPVDAQPFLPILEGYLEWSKEFNKAKLQEIIAFLKQECGS